MISKSKSITCLFFIAVLIIGIYIGQVNINKKSAPVQSFGASTSSGKAVKAFLKKNCSNIDINKKDAAADFNVLDEDVRNNDVFLTGEGHATVTNYNLKLAFIKYFSEKADIRYFLWEVGYSASCYINRYLETGNEENLKIVYNNLKGTLSYNKEEYNFWINLRKYNLSLPESKRIKVIGIDVEHQTDTACSYLRSILPDKEDPGRTRFTNFKKIMDSNSPMDLGWIMHDLQKDIQDNPKECREYLGDNFFDFSMIVDNIINSINFYGSGQVNGISDIREGSIYSNFKRVYEYLPEGKYYGQFGSFHIMQKPTESTAAFAVYLNREDSPVRGKVISIDYEYKNSYSLIKNVKTDISSDIIASQLVKDYCSTDVTLFKLTGEDSPFNERSDYIDPHINGGAVKYFQYIAIIKNSDAVTAYDSSQ
ncbi:MAG: hypothetical protein Q8930_03150 [Bacillota bacterium]|nr:hypothetical protein [Bacillota bacterium]